jgi:hypothetical protein
MSPTRPQLVGRLGSITGLGGPRLVRRELEHSHPFVVGEAPAEQCFALAG